MKALIQLIIFTAFTLFCAVQFEYTKEDVIWIYGIYALLSISQRLDKLIDKK